MGSNLEKFYKNNQFRIDGLVKTHGVDESVAKDMLASNIKGASNYAGAGVADMNQLAAEYKAALDADSVADAQKQSSLTATSNEDLINQLYKAREEAQLSALRGAINKQVSDYEEEIEKIPGEYQSVKNQSEVNRYKSKKALKESMANAGLTESGLGRSEKLNLNATYDNNLSEINTAEANAVAELRKAIADTKASGSLQETQIINENTAERLAAQLEAEQQRVAQEREDFLGQLQSGAWSNDYQQRIDEISGDGDDSNNWMIPYLQGYRENKIAAQEAAAAEAEQQAFENQISLIKASKNSSNSSKSMSRSEALKMYESGIVTPEVLNTLGIGDTSQLGRNAQNLLNNLVTHIQDGTKSASDAVSTIQTQLEHGVITQYEATIILAQLGI